MLTAKILTKRLRLYFTC